MSLDLPIKLNTLYVLRNGEVVKTADKYHDNFKEEIGIKPLKRGFDAEGKLSIMNTGEYVFVKTGRYTRMNGVDVDFDIVEEFIEEKGEDVKKESSKSEEAEKERHVAALEKQNKEFYAEINNLKAQNEKLNNEVADLVANAQAVEGNGESGRVIELENRISGLKGELEREKKERGVYHKSLVEFEKLFEAACFHRDALFEMLAIERGWNK